MATYNGWTELREYRVWMCDDIYAVATVSRHTNGRYRVDVDGEDEPYRTTSKGAANRYAELSAEQSEGEAVDTCECGEYGDDECKDASTNPYNSPHGVRTQVVDMLENRELAQSEL